MRWPLMFGACAPPTLPDYELLGDLWMAQEQPGKALTAYRHSLELYPNRANSLRGVLAGGKGDTKLKTMRWRKADGTTGTRSPSSTHCAARREEPEDLKSASPTECSSASFRPGAPRRPPARASRTGSTVPISATSPSIRYQGRGLARRLIGRLRDASASHRKIICMRTGKEGFYEKLGFLPMKTAMAIFRNRDHAISTGWLEERETRACGGHGIPRPRRLRLRD